MHLRRNTISHPPQPDIPVSHPPAGCPAVRKPPMTAAPSKRVPLGLMFSEAPGRGSSAHRQVFPTSPVSWQRAWEAAWPMTVSFFCAQCHAPMADSRKYENPNGVACLSKSKTVLSSPRWMKPETFSPSTQEGCSSPDHAEHSGHNTVRPQILFCFPARKRAGRGIPGIVWCSRCFFKKCLLCHCGCRNFGNCRQCFFKTSIGKTAHLTGIRRLNPAASPQGRSSARAHAAQIASSSKPPLLPNVPIWYSASPPHVEPCRRFRSPLFSDRARRRVVNISFSCTYLLLHLFFFSHPCRVLWP